jgi:hypothetical protein
MEKQYIKLKYVVARQNFEGALEECLDTSRIEVWRKGENKYVGFYDVVVEYIATYSEFDQDLARLYPYYSGFLYTLEEIQKIREFGNYLWDWAHAIHPKAEQYQKKYRNYDYVYLTDKRFKTVQKNAKKLYDYLKANDKKYGYEKSLNTYLEDESWYDYECETIRKHDYERFFNVTLWNGNRDIGTTESTPNNTETKVSLIKKIKNFTKKLW